MLRKLSILAASLVVALTSLGVAAAQETQSPASNNKSGVQQPERRRALKRHLARRQARLGGARGLRQLNLTDAQRQQAQSIVRSSFESNKAVREELMQLMQKRREGTLSETDQARARELRQQLHESRKNARTQLATLLTEEQRAKLEERRKQRRERR